MVSFKQLTKGLTDRIEIVVRFLAVLELYKLGILEIDQMDSFGEISVSWCSDAELSDMDLLDIYEG
jgi:segregation and condensation protein A